MQTDKTFRIRHENTANEFMKVLNALGKYRAMILHVSTVYVGQTYITRDITVAVKNEKDSQELHEQCEAIPGIFVEGIVDEVMRMHEGGKMIHRGRIPISSMAQMREVYTPGVAKVCYAIQADPLLARRYTNAGNTVAVVSNGSRVLGLGDIGPLASLPVMEAKAMFYGQLVDLNAVPIILDVQGVEAFVETVQRLSVGFAGIHLEDIRSPDCMIIEQRLIELLDKPVMHDDQHGTAVVALAATINLPKKLGRGLDTITFGQVGMGAAGMAITSLMLAAGCKRVMGTDRNNDGRAQANSRGIEYASFEEITKSADVLCLTTGKAGLLLPEMVRPGQIILALSNPSPEIEPADALKAGAAGALDGRSVNNLLGYPGLFKGAIMSNAKQITTIMKLEAANVIASLAPRGEILPDALQRSVHSAVTTAVSTVSPINIVNNGLVQCSNALG